MDETRKSTLNLIEDSEISISSTGHKKQKLTVTLGAYADGTKLSPLVLLAALRPSPKEDIPVGIVVYMG